MAKKENLSPESYQRQISGLKPLPSKGDKSKNFLVAVKVSASTKDQLKAVPNWQDKLRAAIDQIIEDNQG